MGTAKITLAGILIVTGIVVLILFAAAVIVDENRMRTSHHTFDYHIWISTDVPCDNLTVILPLPVIDASSPLGEGLLHGSGYNVHEDWNFSVVEADNSMMLKIFVPRFIPGRVAFPQPIPEEADQERSSLPDGSIIQTIPLATQGIPTGGARDNTAVVKIKYDPETNGTTITRNAMVVRPVVFGVRAASDRSIDTRDPVGKEPLLNQKKSLHSVNCRFPVSTTTRCYEYDSRVYVDYSSLEPADFEISVSVAGTNEWWEMGWSSNSYMDRITVHSGNRDKGWLTASGALQTGNGRY